MVLVVLAMCLWCACGVVLVGVGVKQEDPRSVDTNWQICHVVRYVVVGVVWRCCGCGLLGVVLVVWCGVVCVPACGVHVVWCLWV